VTHISPENALYPLFTTFHDPVRCGASVLLGTLAPNAWIVRFRLDAMLTAFILVESTRDGLTHLGSDLAAVEGVAEVYTVTGDWDFIAIVRVREHDDLAKVVTQHLTRLDGIERTQTMVAFQQFSAHDLEAMFGLGLEDKKA
jgi:DNA-binding Lrp family transcriptional regulator